MTSVHDGRNIRVVTARMVMYHWWFSKGNGVWAPYSTEDTEILEHAFSVGIDQVELQGGLYTVEISERTQLRAGGSRRPVLRGLWYYEASNGSLVPFLEDIANSLETHFSSVLGETTCVIDQQRTIHRTATGSFEQIRSETGRVRRVVRGYIPFENKSAGARREGHSANDNGDSMPGQLVTAGSHGRESVTGVAVLELAHGYTKVNATYQRPRDTTQCP